MRSADILSDALTYAIDRQGGVTPPVAVLNAHGSEDETYVKQSNDACKKLKSTISGVFSTILIRATRQHDETLGLVSLAASLLGPDGKIIIAQDNAHGAPGLEKMLRRAFPNLDTLSKFKCRVMTLAGSDGDAATLLRWTQKAAVQKVMQGDFWSAPGVFSWDRADPGSRLLLAHLPPRMDGAGADLGCGNGFLSAGLAKKPGVTGLYCIDADARAVECCRLNLEDRKLAIPVHVLWCDATGIHADIPKLDWIVMNPPFHTQQEESRELGQKFCASALKMLRSGGMLYLVANRHMPYEAILEKGAAAVTLLADTDGFKIIAAKAK